jgi:arginine-tRNA-protein transferase
MQSAFQFVAAPSTCGYLPEETWQLEYDIVSELSAAEYQERLEAGWRRFGHALFRPRCPSCNACQSLRVVAPEFRPNRSQRRVRQANAGVVELGIGRPSVSRERLDLYDRFHAFQARAKGWPEHPPKDLDSFVQSFIDNPFPTTEWCYYVDGRLVGVGYVDVLPAAYSAIYFVYDPRERARSLGTWNVLCQIEAAAARRIPFVYLGYYVPGCASMAYKAKFHPHEIRHANGEWRGLDR